MTFLLRTYILLATVCLSFALSFTGWFGSLWYSRRSINIMIIAPAAQARAEGVYCWNKCSQFLIALLVMQHIDGGMGVVWDKHGTIRRTWVDLENMQDSQDSRMTCWSIKALVPWIMLSCKLKALLPCSVVKWTNFCSELQIYSSLWLCLMIQGHMCFMCHVCISCQEIVCYGYVMMLHLPFYHIACCILSKQYTSWKDRIA